MTLNVSSKNRHWGLVFSTNLSIIFPMSKAGYSKEDLLRIGLDDSPARGPICPKCGLVIPDFADLTSADEIRLRKLISEGRWIMAMQELRSLTMCPISWAKIWVLHGGRPGTTAPCPYCGKPLVTALAKQCKHCNMDWHDPENPKRLGSKQFSDTSP